MLRLFPSQGNGIAENAKFYRVTAKGGTGKFNFGALHQAENHQSLHIGVRRIDGIDNVLLTSL